MNPPLSHVANQQRNFLQLIAALRPHWRTDPNLPARLQAWLASHRGFGSRDRRLYRELLYATLRYLPWIEPLLDLQPELALQCVAWLAAESPATTQFRRASLAGWPACPADVAQKSAGLVQHFAHLAEVNENLSTLPAELSVPLPLWFRAHCPAAFEPTETNALLSRAPLWLRLQVTDPTAAFAEFDSKGWRYARSAFLPSAIELKSETDVTKSDAFINGLIEVQDLGSQLILAALAVNPGGRWLDACAGAGGKTLQLAALIGGEGRIDAHDVRTNALTEFAIRAQRAGLRITIPNELISPATQRPRRTAPHRPPAARISIVRSVNATQLYDAVLVDAPCTGSGTWRRAPHLKWSTTPEQIVAAANQQGRLLDQFSGHVRPGGKLIYATCSLSALENQDVVSAFLERHPDFKVEPLAQHFGFTPDQGGLTILPSRHNTDGFFVACLDRS